MKTLIPALVISILSSSVLANSDTVSGNVNNPTSNDDKVIQHKFKAGDTVSADVFNEISDNINLSSTGFLSQDELVGAWECTYYYSVATVNNYTKDSTCSSYLKKESNVVYSSKQNIVFKDDGSVVSEREPLLCFNGSTDWNSPKFGLFGVVNGSLATSLMYNSYPEYYKGYISVHSTKRLNKNKFQLNSTLQSSLGISCAKLDTLPEVPGELSVAQNKSVVTLTWENTESKKTSYVIMKRVAKMDENYGWNSTPGEWVELAEVSPDETTYTDNLSGQEMGQYWYRIFSKNDKGLSQGSNVPSSLQYISKEECISYYTNKTYGMGYVYSMSLCGSMYPELYQ